MGDLNARTVEKFQNQIVGQYGEDMENANGRTLIEMCRQNNFRIVNWVCFHHRWIRKYTCTYLRNVRLYRGGTCGSDYVLLVAKMVFRTRTQTNEQAQTDAMAGRKEIPRYNLRSFETESV